MNPINLRQIAHPLLIALCAINRLSLADEPRVNAPPDSVRQSLQLSPFYKKHVSAGGIPIVASDKVSDFAMLEAADIIQHMLEGRDDVRRALVNSDAKLRVAIMAPTEFTTDIPEHSSLRPKQFWDKRARGLGATRQRPAVSCGEENLLCYPGDPYVSENILVHEFGHVIHELGLNAIDPTFDRRLTEAYEKAMKAGLWAGKYASQNRMEYWAEGVQSWFDTNRVNDHDHNAVHTRAQLQEYDSGLAALLAEVFGDRAWRYVEPAKRKDRAHLKGYDPSKAPTFAWPAELLAWNKAHPDGQAEAMTDTERLPLLAAELKTLPKSKQSSTKTTIVFVNHTGQQIVIFWNDWNGRRKSYGRIHANESESFDTFAGHAWIVTDPHDKLLAVVVASDKPGRAVIERPPRP